MTKEELKQEAEEWLNKWELCNKCENKVDCISNFSYCKKVVLQSYLASVEPREKQIQIDAEQIRALQKQNGELTDELKALRESIKDYGAGCYENGLRNGKRKLEEQLTKAKEIIKAFLDSSDLNIKHKAEEFLGEF
jgi:uncharacterized protein YhaN